MDSLSQIEGCSYLDSAKMESVTSHFSWTASGFFNEILDEGLEELKCGKLIVHIGTVC